MFTYSCRWTLKNHLIYKGHLSILAAHFHTILHIKCSQARELLCHFLWTDMYGWIKYPRNVWWHVVFSEDIMFYRHSAWTCLVWVHTQVERVWESRALKQNTHSIFCLFSRTSAECKMESSTTLCSGKGLTLTKIILFLYTKAAHSKTTWNHTSLDNIHTSLPFANLLNEHQKENKLFAVIFYNSD